MEATNPVIEALTARKLELEIAALETERNNVVTGANENGVFSFVGTVHEDSCHLTIARIDQYLRRHPDSKKIEILMNSIGGSVPDGLALIDYLHMLRRDGIFVRITGIGIVASMASAILMAASERVLTPHAWLGLHEVQSVIQGSLTHQEDGIQFAKGLQDQIVTLLCERSTLTPAKLKHRWSRKDVFIGATEALKLGLIDRIEAV